MSSRLFAPLRLILMFGFFILNLTFIRTNPLYAQNSTVAQRDSSILSDTINSSLYLPIITTEGSGNSLPLGYGIQAYLPVRSQTQRAMVTTLYLGFDWIKDQVSYSDLYISFGDTYYLRWGHLDEVVNLADENGLSIVLSIVHIPNITDENSRLHPQLYGIPPIVEVFTAIADRYCGRSLKAIEVLNEPNLKGYELSVYYDEPELYVNLMQTVNHAVKNECPMMQIISAGLAPTADSTGKAKDDLALLDAWLNAGLGEVVDGIGAHPYGFNVPPTVTWEDACEAIKIHGNSFNGPCDTPHRSWSFRSTMESYHQLLIDKGFTSKPIWVTEFGWAAGGALESGYEYANDNDLEEQSDWTVEAFQMLEEWGWVRVATLWNLNYRVVTPNQHHAQWGIVTESWKPLPVFSALARMPKNGVVTLAANQVTYDGSFVAEDPANLDQIEAIEAPEPVTIVLFSIGLTVGAMTLYRKKSSNRKVSKI